MALAAQPGALGPGASQTGVVPPAPAALQALPAPELAALELAALELAALECAIFGLLAQRQPGASICPSDAARAVYTQSAQWRSAMPAVRALAAGLADAGRLVVTQGRQTVNLRQAKGPVRLRLPPA